MSTKAVKGTEVDGDVAVGRHATVGGDTKVRGDLTVDGDLIVGGRTIVSDISGGAGSGSADSGDGESEPTVLFFDVFDTESVLNTSNGATATVRAEVAPLGAEIVWCSRDNRFYGRFAGEFYYAFAGHKQYGDLNGKGITCKPDVLYVHRTGDVYIRRALVNSAGSTYYTLVAVSSELIRKLALRSLVYEAATRKLIGKSADGSVLTEVALPTATSNAAGLMSKEDKSTTDSLKLMQGAFENTGVATLKGTPVYMIDVLVRVPAGTEQPELPTPEEFGAQGGELVVAVDYDGNARFSGIVLPADSGGGYIIRELPLTMTREEISADKWPGLKRDRRLVRRATSYYLRGGGIYAGTSWDGSDFAVAFVANEEGALSCLSSMSALKELQERLFALETRCEEEIPTPQATSEGDESQYVYSVADGNDARCVMTMRNTAIIQNGGQLMLRRGFWSVASEGGKYVTTRIPLVTTSADGAMSKDVLNRLGTGASIYEGTPTTTTVPISYPNWASGGSRTFTLRAATSARAGVMTAAQFNQLNKLAEKVAALEQRVMALELEKTPIEPEVETES